MQINETILSELTSKIHKTLEQNPSITNKIGKAIEVICQDKDFLIEVAINLIPDDGDG